jgi:Flp pilus assembly protein TadD
VTATNQIITDRLREAADLLEPQAANPPRRSLIRKVP